MNGEPEKIPIVECACGNEVVLNEARKKLEDATFCTNCFRKLYWLKGKPVAIREKPKPEVKELKILRYMK
jgi:hypothetical protein